MYAVAETAEFSSQAARIWNDAEHDAFVDFIAANPEAGDVIPGAGGARKVRWAASGRGKRGGARVIYFNLLDDGLIVLIAVYVKSERENLPAKATKRAKHEAEEH